MNPVLKKFNQVFNDFFSAEVSSLCHLNFAESIIISPKFEIPKMKIL
jgi:hypothetical protein